MSSITRIHQKLKKGNDSNLLIVFYVQIMPDDFVMQLHRFCERQRLPSQPCRCCLRFRLCRSIRCVYRLLITCSFPFRRDSYSGQPSVIHITTSKGDSRLIRRPSVAIVRSPNTCANRLPEPVIRVKQPALARFSPDVSPLFVHFRADDDVTARLYARGYRLRPEFLSDVKSC